MREEQESFAAWCRGQGIPFVCTDDLREAIVTLYDRLAEQTPSSAVLTNRAAAIALADGPAAGLAALHGIHAAPGDHRLLVLRAELHAQRGFETARTGREVMLGHGVTGAAAPGQKGLSTTRNTTATRTGSAGISLSHR